MKWCWPIVCFLAPWLASAQTLTRTMPVCATCHVEARSQITSSMGNALETPAECKILASRPLLTTTVGKYSYRIERQGSQSIYTVSEGAKSLSLPIRWAMGASSAIGQTYILEKDGDLYESRVSYFRELDGLGPTLGSEGSSPEDLADAAGRLMGKDDKLRCFGCHATDATSGRDLTLDTMTPGVQCERCHGPAKDHVEAAKAGNPGQAPMKDLSAMSTEQISNFCGQCHRTWEEIVLDGKLDITDLRFQPYRLVGSKCYDANDPRISCLACHDPHHDVDTEAAHYDSKCLACHNQGKAGARMCKVSKQNCASCHMPKIELPGAFHKFSDHRIRIVRAGEPFPG